jgi:glycosyltransferase involved in cell wall biosynthesis
MSIPFISVCIPAYKRTEFLKRLLDSLMIQNFKNFEVVITDDSPGNDVKTLVQGYSELPIKYFRNEHALGTPENWNEGLRQAKGGWIKIMHDDDWFTNESICQRCPVRKG